MKIVVITGTPQKGVTYLMKEDFLSHLRKDNQVIEFYPYDLPPFCCGCKSCFIQGVENCPHKFYTSAIWDAIMQAELIVFAYPVYALRAPAAIKSLLDHFCVHWLVHRPEKEMFSKTAVIITNSVGAPNGSAQKDVRTSLNWMGLSRVYTVGMGMMGDIFIDKMTQKHRKTIEKKMALIARKVTVAKQQKRMSLKIRILFAMARLQHKLIMKSETTPSLDNQHYIDNGWLTR